MYWCESMPGHRHTPKSEVNEYSCPHKLCFTSANSRQTFSQNAHGADQHPLPLLSPLLLQYLTVHRFLSSLPPSTLLTQHYHLSYHSIHLPISTSLSSLPLHYFCSTTPPSPLSPLSWGYWPTWQALMISPVFVGPRRTWMTSLSLNHPLISTAGGTVHLEPAPILTGKSSSHATSCIF